MRRTQKRTENPKARKSAKWHGNEEQMNISVYHMLQSYGIQDRNYLKKKVKNEIHILGLKRLIQDFEILVSIFPEWDYH